MQEKAVFWQGFGLNIVALINICLHNFAFYLHFCSKIMQTSTKLRSAGKGRGEDELTGGAGPLLLLIR